MHVELRLTLHALQRLAMELLLWWRRNFDDIFSMRARLQ
jgi:hypothetical protein